MEASKDWTKIMWQSTGQQNCISIEFEEPSDCNLLLPIVSFTDKNILLNQ